MVDNNGEDGTLGDMKRMRGEHMEDGSYMGTVSRVLSMAGFRSKALVPSRTKVQAEVEAIGGKFLGLGFDLEKNRSNRSC